MILATTDTPGKHSRPTDRNKYKFPVFDQHKREKKGKWGKNVQRGKTDYDEEAAESRGIGRRILRRGGGKEEEEERKSIERKENTSSIIIYKAPKTKRKQKQNKTKHNKTLHYSASYYTMLETIGGLSEFGSVISKERLGSYNDRISSLKRNWITPHITCRNKSNDTL